MHPNSRHFAVYCCVFDPELKQLYVLGRDAVAGAGGGGAGCAGASVHAVEFLADRDELNIVTADHAKNLQVSSVRLFLQDFLSRIFYRRFFVQDFFSTFSLRLGLLENIHSCDVRPGRPRANTYLARYLHTRRSIAR